MSLALLLFSSVFKPMSNKTLLYPAWFYPEQDGGYSVIAPDLPGCATQGDTLEEAYEMGIDAISGWILDELESGGDIPKPSFIFDLKPEYQGGFCQYLPIDIATYAQMYGSKSVKVNCTIPIWLKEQAKRSGVNFSKALQEGLIKDLGF